MKGAAPASGTDQLPWDPGSGRAPRGCRQRAPPETAATATVGREERAGARDGNPRDVPPTAANRRPLRDTAERRRPSLPLPPPAPGPALTAPGAAQDPRGPPRSAAAGGAEPAAAGAGRSGRDGGTDRGRDDRGSPPVPPRPGPPRAAPRAAARRALRGAV